MKHILLTITLIFGATALNAAAFQGKEAFEILEKGKIIHSKPVAGFKNPVAFTFSKNYSVIYRKKPYVCMIDRTKDGTFASCFEDQREP